MPEFHRAYPHVPTPKSEAAVLFPFVGDDLLVREGSDGSVALLRGKAPEGALIIGTLDGTPCAAYATDAPLDDDQVEGDRTRRGLRALWGQLGEAEWAIAGYALQLVRWRKNARFCPACAEKTLPDDGWSVRCGACGFLHYPPVTPAVLCLVHDGADRVLLGTKEGWGDRYSILAGFVEPGESLEDTCHRETIEEAGIKVHALRYDGSQPWPFPHQLMVAFWAQGDASLPLTIDEAELKDARWFHVDELRETTLPGKLSLSRQTLDRWIASRGREISP